MYVRGSDDEGKNGTHLCGGDEGAKEDAMVRPLVQVDAELSACSAKVDQGDEKDGHGDAGVVDHVRREGRKEVLIGPCPESARVIARGRIVDSKVNSIASDIDNVLWRGVRQV